MTPKDTLLTRVNDLQDSLDHTKESIEEANVLLGALRFLGDGLDAEYQGWQDLFTGNTKDLLKRLQTLEEGLQAGVLALDMLMNPPPNPRSDSWFHKRDELIQKAKEALG